MGNYYDSSVLRLLENGVHRRNIYRNNTDRVNTLRDQILYQLCLCGCIDGTCIYLIAVYTGFLCKLFDTCIHADKPWVRRILRHNGDFPSFFRSLCNGLISCRIRLSICCKYR